MSQVVKDFHAAQALTTEEIGQRYFGNHPIDACGVVGIASLTGKPQHKVLQRAVLALAGLEHRGAESADGVSGDGAGLLFSIPKDFFADYLSRDKGFEVDPARIGLGQIFLPKPDQHPTAYLQGVKIVEDGLAKYGITSFAWREPEVNSATLGPIAASTEPATRQIIFECPTDSIKKNEALLHKALMEIEKNIAGLNNKALDDSFYICSLSSAVVDYKAMVKPSHLVDYNKDIQLFLSNGVEAIVALAHQRFATNAAPNWKLAHPYRYIAHNGEINTIKSSARDADARTVQSVEPGHRPIQTSGSDTAQLDTIIGTMIANGWEPIQALRHNIPPALHPAQPKETQDYIRVTNALSSQSDGPAGIVCTDGIQFAAVTDRNSLRPMNCVQVGKDLLIVASEMGSGLLPGDKTSRVLMRGGQGVTVNLPTGQYMKPLEVERYLASAGPYSTWVRNIETFTPKRIIGEVEVARLAGDKTDRLPLDLIAQMRAVGFTEEDRKDVIATLSEGGKEFLSSMGNTKPPAVLSNLPHIHALLSNFFPQDFAQVTNPAIDSQREGSSFDMMTRLGDRGDLLSAHPDRLKSKTNTLIELESPILTTQEFTELKGAIAAKGWKTHTLDCVFKPSEWRNFEKRVDAIIDEAVTAVENGATQLVVSHRMVGQDHAHIPSILIVSGIDKALKERGSRHKVNIHAEAADIHDTHSISQNITSGADTVTPFMAERLLTWTYRPTPEDPHRAETALKTYKKGVHAGVMKIMSKMGITTLNSYRGGHVHSALGLDRDMTEKYFGDSVVNPISGMTMQQLAYSIARNHTNSYAEKPSSTLHLVGRRTEVDGEIDLHTQTTIRLLREATDPSEGSFEKFLAYSAEANRIRTEKVITPDGHEIERRSPVLLRDLWGFKTPDVPLPLEEVQSVASIISNHLSIAAMSYGALSKPMIEVLNRVAASLNMEVNSGEGGQDENLPYGATTMQVASGRFGVTNKYLNSPNKSGRPRKQLKMGQGAKPGEGGQLMGAKITEDIARVRHSIPGVDLISPPPHHSIYSIEDLAQEIRDLDAANPLAPTGVKLVSGSGVGEVASGVVKCNAFEVEVSGNDGGTGAAALTSIMHAGWPIEIGLASTQQNLVMKGMRAPTYQPEQADMAFLKANGSVRTGRDIVALALLGADSDSLGTAIAQAAGCLMVRHCQDNTCPVGIASHDPAYKLIEDAEQRVRNFLLYLAEDTRHVLATIGIPSLPECRGQTDIFVDRRELTPEAYSEQVRNLDLSPLLHVAQQPANIAEIKASRANVKPKPGFDERALSEFWETIRRAPANGNDGPVVIERNISNTDLSIGTRISGAITRERMEGRNPRDVLIHAKGYAGQSLGAYLVNGVKIVLDGEGNDYVGKGLSGGTITVRSPANQNRDGETPSDVVGHAVLYGATGGKAFFDGSAGGRFAVRNSGAEAVVKGSGDYFGEYMTNGFIVCLGPTGKGAFAGHTGGIFAMYDPKGNEGAAGTSMVNDPKTGLPYNWNAEGRQIVRLDGAHGKLQLDENYAERTRDLLQQHYSETRDPMARRILENWDKEVGNFWVVIPDQYAAARKRILEKAAATAAVPAV